MYKVHWRSYPSAYSTGKFQAQIFNGGVQTAKKHDDRLYNNFERNKLHIKWSAGLIGDLVVWHSG